MIAQKVALVTGGSRGIGRATVERLAADGYSVVINYRESQAAAEDLVKQLPAGRALAVQADVSDRADVATLVERVTDAFGRLDVLVNNAGQTLVGDWRTL